MAGLREVVRAFPDYELEAGRIARVWVAADNLTLLDQLR